MVTSCAVDALCIAFGPGDANDTLPTSTFWHTVRLCPFTTTIMPIQKNHAKKIKHPSVPPSFKKIYWSGRTIAHSTYPLHGSLWRRRR